MTYDTVYVPWRGWQVARILGAGNYGAVYEICRFIGDQTETAAMKIITIPHSQEDIEHDRDYGYSDENIINKYNKAREKVLEEYQVMMSLKGHSNIVSCEDIYSEKLREGIGWRIYIRMEYLQPLLEYSQKHNFDEDEIRKLGTDICQALVLCEQKNIVHRDIKPENILVSNFGSFKLADFGIAKIIDHTTTATRVGTMPYMAPEVVKNGHYGQSVDIYSLGMVLYRFLNNFRMPFEPQRNEPPDAEVRAAAYFRRIRGDALPLPVNGSSELKLIVRKACEYDPKKRFSTAQEMLDALENLPKISHYSNKKPVNQYEYQIKKRPPNIEKLPEKEEKTRSREIDDICIVYNISIFFVIIVIFFILTLI